MAALGKGGGLRQLALGLVVLALAAIGLGRCRPQLGAPPAEPAGARAVGDAALQSPGLVVRQAELRFATRPAPGVWAELIVVLDNPAALAARRTVLLLPPTFADDYDVRDTEPELLVPPERRPDGRYALSFPPPLDRSLNWYRLDLAVRRPGPRPLAVGVVVDGPGAGRVELPSARPRAVRSDRAADPFLIVPELLLRWVPDRSPALLSLLIVSACILAGALAGGCLVAFWLVRR